DARHSIDMLLNRIITKASNSVDYCPPAPVKLDISNYPNPFNPFTTVTFSLPLPGKVKLTVYNTRGQRVKELIDQEMPRGFHKLVWNGRDNNNRGVGSGIYFIRLESGGKSNVHKVMLIK
ncbi:MAG: T9SS type A sorting domain-containing protein, partial [Candidatus Cloacimonadaceae bacterium]|nr:T9SS type A sorting domain-containing protein [Candidatus Cloacimonadaceae bacterium]